MNIFFDLDGTLIDSKERLYRLFQHLVPKSNLKYEEYWELKQNKINHREILVSKFNYNINEFQDFEKKWMVEIENPNWLKFDKPFEGIKEMLGDLSRNNQVFIVTARQSELLAVKQISEFGWKEYLNKILVTSQKSNKANLIKKTIFVESTDWFVGDTGKDIETGKILGIRTVGVLSGFLNFESLKPYNADFIINKTIEFKDIIYGKFQK